MNIKKICTIILVVILGLTVIQPSFSVSAQQELPHLSLSDFLEQMSLTFDEYIALVAQFAEEGILTHYLDKNIPRYEAFAESNPTLSPSAVYAFVNINVDFGPYNKIQQVPEQELSGITMLVNKNFGLPEGWEAEDMVTLSGGFRVREEAAEHLTNMMTALKETGGRIFLRSTYRTYETSARLHRNAVNNYGAEIADLNWARGGHSEHQTALSADMLHRTDTNSLTEARFETTDEYKWLRDNAHNYGYILRYPLEYEEITGYKFEPWHWRYVGIDVATAMYRESIPVYEQFYGTYLASDVLDNVKRLVDEQRERAEAEERERLEREELERQAQEDAERAEEEARLAAEEQARLQAERLAQQQEEEALRAGEEESEAYQSELRRVKLISISVVSALFIGIIASAVFLRKYTKKRSA